MTADATARTDAKGPLTWLRVVDLTDLRGALCARILADLGADVVHVERAPHEDSDSTAYRYRHANKRGTVLALDDAADRDRLGGHHRARGRTDGAGAVDRTCTSPYGLDTNVRSY